MCRACPASYLRNGPPESVSHVDGLVNVELVLDSASPNGYFDDSKICIHTHQNEPCIPTGGFFVGGSPPGVAFGRPGTAGRRRIPEHGAAVRLHGFSFQQGRWRRRRARLPPFRAAPQSRVLTAPAVRRRGRDRACVCRRAGGERRARARTGLHRLPALTPRQHSRRHAADASRHHQRTARAAGLQRRRAAVRRHGDRAEHLVRGRRRAARRDCPRLPLSRVRRRAAQRPRIHGGGRNSWRPPEGLRVERAERGLHGPPRVSRCARPHAGREHVDRRVQLRRAAARHHSAASARRTPATGAIGWSCEASSPWSTSAMRRG